MTANDLLLGTLERAPAGSRRPLAEVLDGLAWNADGLVPAIAQDVLSGTVLMLAWMNRAALEATITSGQATYWSRSRGRLWRKGETSGHTQQVRAVRFDCDGDTVLLEIEQTGPACHTGRRDCFYLSVESLGTTDTDVIVGRDPIVDPDAVYGG